MTDYRVIDHDNDNEKTADSLPEAKKKARTARDLGSEHVEIIEPEPKADGGQADMSALVENPIDWLRGINEDYVNTVKGTPSISKQGFRFIQSRFEISTESELAKSFDEPLGVIVWAKAELPDGRSAEAHGEGWQFESGADDNEFVRYADTRAKNRALSDLTSSGALATEELK